ncbi:MAG: NAD-dependent epimerase/dehydratase family protein [Chloroflexi bacterium]|nr:NAD-dependent epimerase/dehydratase family protein [Chloroflexota bacterium]MCI0648990.1 NAD-dependent epimerase/dehydratase family protein [Chloroflexota bacterium]MCI0729425.1 NAD-dependent epimerase/dehydratase family protein [Chloroflexota bacterium]
MKAFVTGGTGFIGQHLVRKLLERGYDVYALARSPESASDLAALGAHIVPGDIGQVDSMREAMRGSDVVFHLAGWYKIGAPDWMKAESINVGGTRKVLRLAHELGVPRIVYASTVAVFGDTKGKVVDESFYQGGPFLSEYDRTKWLAHYKVAVPVIERGAPVIITMPGGVYGPGDHSSVGQMMRLFYEGKMPILYGPETTLTYAHVEDIAEGILLAAEKGQPGESYILAGPAVPLGEMFDFWAQITGKRAPVLRIPAALVRPFASLIGFLGSTLSLPDVYSREAAQILGATYMARADKARAKLGWRPRSLHEGMKETFAWIAAQPPAKAAVPRPERRLAALAFGTALVLFLSWYFTRRRKS